MADDPNADVMDEQLGIPSWLRRPFHPLGNLSLPVPMSPSPNPTAPRPTATVAPPPPPPDENALPMPSFAQRQGLPQMAPKMEPESQRLMESKPGYAQVQNPFLRGLGHAGSIAAGIVAPGIAPLIPGTQAHHDMLINQALGREGLQARQGLEEAQTAAQNAEVPEREAATEHVKAETEALKNPKPQKPENLAQEHSDAVIDAINRGVDPQSDPKVKQIQDAITSVQPERKQPAEKDSQQFADEYKKLHPNATVAEIQRAYKLNQELPQRPPQVMVMVPQAGGGEQAQLIRPGQTVGEGAVTPQQMGQRNMPTTQQRNVAAQAALVHERTPEILANIDKNAAALGPVEGRWNEFMQGKVGMDNQALADLRADLLMYSSAVALMHARGRLPENLREEFDAAINAPRQTAGNLKATIRKIDEWTADNMKAMGGQQPSPAEGGGISIQRDANGRIIGVK